MLRALAGRVAASRLLRRGKTLWQENQSDYDLPLSKLQKVLVGVYLILHDYGTGEFPPAFSSAVATHDAEREYRSSLPGIDIEAVREREMRKPFWFGAKLDRYLGATTKLAECLDRLGRPPPARLLELGCGTGWLCEFLAQMGYRVTGLTLSNDDITDARARAAGLAARGLDVDLEFVEGAMERVRDAVPHDRFDVVFTFEALHHAFSWEQTIESSIEVLEPGGWLLLANEPNLIHTFSSYRVSRLAGTHEIGMSRRKLARKMRAVGFGETRVLAHRVHGGVLDHWLAARKE